MLTLRIVTKRTRALKFYRFNIWPTRILKPILLLLPPPPFFFFCLFFYGATALIRPRLPHCWSKHSVRLLYMSDLPVAETATYTTHKKLTSMHSADFEPATPAGDYRPTHQTAWPQGVSWWPYTGWWLETRGADDTANATSFVLWIRLKFVVLSMELASCHGFDDDILGWLLDFWEICAQFLLSKCCQ
jgi:hypothetical protein